jgi:CheY-like chemotaxis protein
MTTPPLPHTTWHPPQHEGPLKTVLLVEDEPTTLNLYRMGLKGLHDFRILLAEHGQKAVEYLKAHPVDVMVTDLHMPVMDGFRLISWVSARYPSIPIIVMTGIPETEHMNAPLSMGALRILSKPPRLSKLMDEIRDAAQRHSDGSVRGVGLNSLLQLLNWERKDCTLTVRSEPDVGLMYVKDGQLIHAAFRDKEGLDACYTILNWHLPEVDFVDTCRVEQTIDLPLTEVLMNAALIRDTMDHEAQQKARANDPWATT